jgi:hypothetical protein
MLSSKAFFRCVLVVLAAAYVVESSSPVSLGFAEDYGRYPRKDQ